ncbi:hypothetical protein QQ054_16590 [Oscillatoria amoena NRMC-F 0135]|nr:hypothetical protein [Oscillatoria amoena NRMC-F 0135]
MKKAVFLSAFLALCAPLLAQAVDTLLHVLQPIDSLYTTQVEKLDSIQHQTQIQFQHIKSEYDAVANSYEKNYR